MKVLIFIPTLTLTGLALASACRNAALMIFGFSNNFKLARIVRSPSIQMSHALFWENKVDVLASLKPKLLEETENNEGIRLIDEPFTAIKQSIGLPKEKQDSVAFVNEVIRSSIQRRLACRSA